MGGGCLKLCHLLTEGSVCLSVAVFLEPSGRSELRDADLVLGIFGCFACPRGMCAQKSFLAHPATSILRPLLDGLTSSAPCSWLAVVTLAAGRRLLWPGCSTGGRRCREAQVCVIVIVTELFPTALGRKAEGQGRRPRWATAAHAFMDRCGSRLDSRV